MPISITGKFQPSGGAGSFDLVSASDILDDIGLSITYVIVIVSPSIYYGFLILRRNISR